MKQEKSRLILSLLSAGTLVAIIDLQSGKKINPNGWHEL